MTNEEIFAGLRDIGYATEGKFTFFKNKFSPQWKFLIHTLIHCLSPKSGFWNQFASNIAIALICLSTGRKYNFSNMIFHGMCHNVSSRTKFLMYPRFLQIILDTGTKDTTPYPAPLVTKKFFANMRHYQGPDMPLLAHMLNHGEPAFVQAHQQEVSLPPPSPVVAPHPSPDPMPSPPPIPFVLHLALEDDDTGGGSFHESPPSPPPATLTHKKATLEAKLKATKILYRDTVVLFSKRIKKLESKLKTKKRKLVLSDSENEEEARQSQELDALLHLANAALHDPNAAIPAASLDSAGVLDSAGGVVFAGGADSASGLTSTGILVAAGPTISAEPSSPIRDHAKGKAVTTPSSPEWIGLVDQVCANPTLSAELLGADVSEDTFSVRMVEMMNQRRKAIAEMKAKAKRDKPMTPAQQKESMRTFNIYDKIHRAVNLATAKDHHQHLKRSGETLEYLDSKKLKSSHSTEQPAELQETTSVFAGATIAAGDPIPAVTYVSAASYVLAETPIAAGVSTTAGASGSASDESVLIFELLDSPC
nr:hypothetical protein [Tanacetum cinerariifolium]